VSEVTAAAALVTVTVAEVVSPVTRVGVTVADVAVVLAPLAALKSIDPLDANFSIQ
jgi:PIN domain nuclease of toxin-antitoxin system